MVDIELPKARMVEAHAAIWKRAASFIADMIIIQLIIFSPFAGAIQSSIPVSSDFMGNYNYFQSHPGIIDQLYAVIGLIFFLMFLYFTIFEYKMGQTPGKMIFRLYVAAADKKESLSIWKVILRNLAVIPVIPFAALWIIDPVYMIFTGQRLSDVFSKTKVIEEVEI